MENQTDSAKIAVYLLESGAVHFNLHKPFIWSSGWHSPIYCDNRKLYSVLEARTFIADTFARKISILYPETDVICGVATGAIGFAALVAERLNLPMIYVRSNAKEHGL
ncbi:MAG: orotate phosphoribosyltransferase, partial [Bacteroidia bacterium]|nr:orotate phosphoribosyltransferase [Bacteroidia bacterium]